MPAPPLESLPPIVRAMAAVIGTAAVTQTDDLKKYLVVPYLTGAQTR
jgi:hypothetical protein